MKNVNIDEMLSLYDYLNRPAGPELGKEVWEAAKKAKIKPDERLVNTKNYSGKILMYPKSFLIEFFSGKQSKLPF